MPSNAPAANQRASEPAASEAWVIGVDIGGTKVAAGLVNRRTGAISNPVRVPMSARVDAAAGLAAVTSAIDALFAQSSDARSASQAIGICAPGPLDPAAGVVLNPPNLPCWRDFPLAAELERKYHVPVKLDNDANAAALAETLWGAGRGHRTVFYVTIGTGIGTGIVFDGQIYHGRTGSAAEGGHITIDYDGLPCACGKRGCIETLAAGPAIARLARARLTDQPDSQSMILALAAGNLDVITSELVGQAYAAGDPIAQQVLQSVVCFLSVWLGNIIDLLEPDVIIMGGGVSTMLKPLFPEITKRLPTCCVNQRCQEIPLLAACFGADVGIAGGAALCVPALHTQ
jgi:glucokinase